MGNPDTPAMSPSPKRDVSTATSDELATVVMRAQAFTSATGAAIALTENDEMICRASSGTTAPDVGVHLSIEGSFTGLAVTSGQALRCDDSETDSRVDAAACRLMRTRSMCVVPVRDHGTIAGVVAVFSSNPNAFSDYHMAVLKTMADLISQSLAKGRGHEAASAPAAKPRVESHAPAAAVPPTPLPRPAPAAVTPAPRPVAVPSPAKPIAVPAPTAPVASVPAAAAPAPAKISPPAPKPKIEQPEPARLSAAAPPREKKKEERITPAPRKEKKEPSGAVPSFGGDRGSIFAQEAPKTESGGNKNMLLIGGGVAAAVVIGLVLYVALGSSHAAPKTASASAPPATTSTPPPAPQPVSTSDTVIPQPAVTATSAPVHEAARPEKPAADKNEPVKQEKPSIPQPAPVMMAGGAVAKPAASSDVAAPTLMPAGGSPGLPALGSAAPAVPTLRTVTVPPRLLQRVNPTYPIAAKQMGMHGSVVLEVKIDNRGNVTDVRPISGNTFFYDAARDAIRQWKYKPQTVNGQPTDSVIQVTVNFEAPR